MHALPTRLCVTNTILTSARSLSLVSIITPYWTAQRQAGVVELCVSLLGVAGPGQCTAPSSVYVAALVVGVSSRIVTSLKLTEHGASV